MLESDISAGLHSTVVLVSWLISSVSWTRWMQWELYMPYPKQEICLHVVGVRSDL
ncbi:hypothetical protein FKM82_005973 [Ascaphus truei]